MLLVLSGEPVVLRWVGGRHPDSIPGEGFGVGRSRRDPPREPPDQPAPADHPERRINVTTGTARPTTELAASDEALRGAGVTDANLVALGSVIRSRW